MKQDSLELFNQYSRALVSLTIYIEKQGLLATVITHCLLESESYWEGAVSFPRAGSTRGQEGAGRVWAAVGTQACLGLWWAGSGHYWQPL